MLSTVEDRAKKRNRQCSGVLSIPIEPTGLHCGITVPRHLTHPSSSFLNGPLETTFESNRVAHDPKHDARPLGFRFSTTQVASHTSGTVKSGSLSNPQGGQNICSHPATGPALPPQRFRPKSVSESPLQPAVPDWSVSSQGVVKTWPLQLLLIFYCKSKQAIEVGSQMIVKKLSTPSSKLR